MEVENVRGSSRRRSDRWQRSTLLVAAASWCARSARRRRHVQAIHGQPHSGVKQHGDSSTASQHARLADSAVSKPLGPVDTPADPYRLALEQPWHHRLPVAQAICPARDPPRPGLVKQWLHPEFTALSRALDEGADVRSLVAQVTHDVYSFPLLNDEACDRLCNEIEHFGETGLPARRPNSMNRYGLILNEVGLRPSLDALQAEVWRVARELWPVEGARFDDHHSFCD